MKHMLRYFGMATVALAAASTAMAETVVIVAAASPVTVLSADQTGDLFLGRATTFPSGAAAIPIDQAEGSTVREDFYTKIANKSGAQIKAYWAKLMFTGKGQPPKEAGDSAGVKSAVAANPSAVGYVDKSVVDGSVRIVLNLH